MSLQTIASPRTSGWRGPIEITWRGSVAMPSIPIHCKCMGGWFVLKSIAHGSKCPIELCLCTDVGRKFSWLMKTCSEFPLHLPDAANKVIQIVHVHMQTSGVRFVKTVNINFIDNLPTFPIMKSLLSYLKLLLICLLELDFGFDQSLLRGKPVGKSPYYRSFDRSANWRVKDSIGEVTYHLPQNAELTCMLDLLLYRCGIPPVVIRCVHWPMQKGVMQTVFTKFIGHFRWTGPNVWWEISLIWIEHIKPIGQMSHEPWKFFSYTVQT